MGPRAPRQMQAAGSQLLCSGAPRTRGGKTGDRGFEAANSPTLSLALWGAQDPRPHPPWALARECVPRSSAVHLSLSMTLSMWRSFSEPRAWQAAPPGLSQG